MATVRSTDGTAITYDVRPGSLPAIVFLHGLGGDSKAWNRTRDALTQQTIAIDLRGHGTSQKRPRLEDYSLQHLAADVSAVVDAEHLGRFILVGHCYGCMVAVSYATLHPSRLRGLVMVAGTHKSPPGMNLLRPLVRISQPLLRRIATGKTAHRDHEKHRHTHDINPMRIGNDVLHTGLHVWLSCASSMKDFDAAPVLRELTCPILVLHGTHDFIFSPWRAHRLHKAVPRVYLDLIPRGTHTVTMRQPELIARKIASFATALTPKSQ